MAFESLVSVLLPFRNNAATLHEALTSVLAERDISLEVIAVNDGSTDEGPAIAAEIARRDPRVHIISTPGIGIARALSLAAGQTRSPFLARMDGDDISLPGRITRAIELLSSNPSLGLAACRVEGFPERAVGEGLFRYIAWQNALISAADHARELFVESPVCHPSVVMRRSAFEAAGGFHDVPWPEDYDLWLRLDACGFGLAKVAEVLFRWRHREGRATFADNRYSLAKFDQVKARYLAPKLRRLARPVVFWGAGKTGKRIARALEPHGIRPARFIDIDPQKVGRTARGVHIEGPDDLRPGEYTIVGAVGARGARDLIRAFLLQRGFEEGLSFFFAS
ncbi:MAG: glycosyltransferase [Polyangiaceae bacterium]|nr:glycosyltransferase [Polyangiaceae bacterium]